MGPHLMLAQTAEAAAAGCPLVAMVVPTAAEVALATVLAHPVPLVAKAALMAAAVVVVQTQRAEQVVIMVGKVAIRKIPVELDRPLKTHHCTMQHYCLSI